MAIDPLNHAIQVVLAGVVLLAYEKLKSTVRKHEEESDEKSNVHKRSRVYRAGGADVEQLAKTVADLRGDHKELRRDHQELADRVSKIDGYVRGSLGSDLGSSS